ncbi:hypothetical protein [Haloferula sargassicola]|uniref:Tetratricopeptide repeat protein n=1 Tax=Haloferula sargassicola TaxID=490096 RepID=A0ABP9US69_9BACT
MRILFIALWCLLPLGLVAFHYGPGQEKMALDHSGAALDRARAHLDASEWEAAIPELEAALAALPEGHGSEAQRIQLELLKARMMTGKLPEARGELEELLARVDASAEPELHADVLEALSSARFHMTYLMKLEGLPETEWGPEIDAARQERKLLLQQAGSPAAASRQADALESAIKLARMDPAELYGKAIPKQCQGCCSGKCNKPGKKPGKKKLPKDARGASSGPPIDGEGS